MKVKKNERGFDVIDFKDRYDHDCSLQKSSLAFEEAIWLGVDDAEPKIRASQAKDFGIETPQRTGWVDFPIPKEVFLNTRMHLTQKQVKKLLPHLIKFVETGNI